MNRKAIITAARKALANRKTDHLLPWIDLMGQNPAPNGYSGPILCISLRHDIPYLIQIPIIEGESKCEEEMIDLDKNSLELRQEPIARH